MINKILGLFLPRYQTKEDSKMMIRNFKGSLALERLTDFGKLVCVRMLVLPGGIEGGQLAVGEGNKKRLIIVLLFLISHCNMISFFF